MDCVLDCCDDEPVVPEVEPRNLRVDAAPPPSVQSVQREDGVVVQWLSAHTPLLYSGAGTG